MQYKEHLNFENVLDDIFDLYQKVKTFCEINQHKASL